MTPIISVIIPVFNHADVLEKTFESLYKQQCRPLLEIIVVDDGSTDNFNAEMERLKQLDWFKELPLKIISAEHQGAAAARNRGFAESVGSFILFWDADTIGAPEMIQIMYETLSARPDAAYVYSQFKFGWKKMKSQPFDADTLREYNYIDTTSLIRRECVVPFDEQLKRFQDWDVWLTLMERSQFGVFIPEVLYQKLVSANKEGISVWQPAFMHRLPWQTKRTKDYMIARRVILTKHHLIETAEE